MRYLIIGLGIYGTNLAIDLTDMGHEVIGADISANLVESIKDYISTAYIVDSTERLALSALPLANVDTVIVAIGENFGASIRTVALLKELGVKRIYARAIDRLHESILEGFHIDRIITPEQRAAMDLTRDMAIGGSTESISLEDDGEHFVIRFTLPPVFEGLRYDEIPVLRTPEMRLIAVTRPSSGRNRLGIIRTTRTIIDTGEDGEKAVAVKGDLVTVYTSKKAFRELSSSL
ncbi:MAG: TrkA family potassium uptake protein [Paramuribaculum sp.]|nr:TrkA family potassium uptake protein [Paramuribaculum sp.]MDE7152483.1 TrkA family potassium uptake protein [Candidatus Amulumruptor sp.]